jgi:hypothetical protein
MRGFPPIHLLLLAVAFALLAVPLVRLTGASRAASGGGAGSVVVAGAAEHPEGEHVHEVPVRVRLRYAHRPEALALMTGETDWLKGVDWQESPVEFEAEMEVGHDGSEFVLEAKWPEGVKSTVVTVEMEPEGMEMRTETRWSDEGRVSDVLTFVW